MDNKPIKHLPLPQFVIKLGRNVLIGTAIILISLLIGMIGYHNIENMSWVDAYLNASMILSGMGPAMELHSDEGKIFAGSYALFSGIIFLAVMALILGPVVHRIIHKFHLEDQKK